MVFSNSISKTNYDIACLSETWLTSEIPNSALFLPTYTIYRKDRVCGNFRSKHGGVLIAIKNQIPHEEVVLHNCKNELMVLRLCTTPKTTLVCAIYNPPTNRFYQWSFQDFVQFFYSLESHTSEISYDQIIIAGVISFSKTNLSHMSSNEEYENGILEILIEHNFSNISESQLDVILTNNLDPITDCKKYLDVLSKFSINNKPCFDQKPINASFIASKNSITIQSLTKYAFKKANWDEINNVIFNYPFDPYCYSNVDLLVKQWYNWIEDIINNNLPKVTKHRSSYPP